MKSSPRWLAKRTLLPSGVQSSTVSSAEWIVRRLTGAAGGRDHVDVHVSLAVGGERDRAAVGREPRVNVAGRVHGQAVDVLAILVGGPDVTQVGEGDLAVVIIGIANQLRLAGAGRALQAGQEHQPERRWVSSWMSFQSGCSSRGIESMASESSRWDRSRVTIGIRRQSGPNRPGEVAKMRSAFADACAAESL